MAAMNCFGVPTNEVSLLQLANEHFGTNLTLAEEMLFQTVANGKMLSYTGDSGKDDDPSNFRNWRIERVIRADRITWLCTDAAASAHVPFTGIGLSRFRIDGSLELQSATIRFPLIFNKCAFADSIQLGQSHLFDLNLDGTYIKDL